MDTLTGDAEPSLVSIRSLPDLLNFIPALVKLHKELDGRWSPDLTAEQFASELVLRFVPTSHYFGQFNDQGQLAYFASVVKDNPAFSTFWLLYVNTKYRSSSRRLVHEILELIKASGEREIRFNTTRLTSSYQRWVKKFGAKPYSTIYRVDLWDL